jgi:hypothetical protein
LFVDVGHKLGIGNDDCKATSTSATSTTSKSIIAS